MLKPLNELTVSVWAGQLSSEGRADGSKHGCKLDHPVGLLVTEAGDVYISDFNAHTIRKTTVDDWTDVETVAGNGQRGTTDGAALECSLSQPTGLCEADTGGIWFVEEGCARLRLLEDGTITTFLGWAGSGFQDGSFANARLSAPRDICRSRNGLLYIADNGNNRIRIVDVINRTVSSIGSGRNTTTDGTFDEACFLYPSSLRCSPDDILFVGELYRVRKVDLQTKLVTTYDKTGDTSLTGGLTISPLFSRNNAPGSESSVFYCDSNGARIMVLDAHTGISRVFAGIGRAREDPEDIAETPKSRYPNGLTKVAFKSPRGIAFTPKGDFLLNDSFSVVRIVRGMYAPSYYFKTPALEHFSLANAEALPPHGATSSDDSSTSPNGAPSSAYASESMESMIGLDSRVATLAYPSLLSLKSQKDLDKLDLPPALQKAILNNPSCQTCSLDIKTRIKSLYRALPAGDGALQQIATLHLIESLKLDTELFDFVLRQLSITLIKEHDHSKLPLYLSLIANEDAALLQVAYLLIEAIRRFSATIWESQQVFDRFVASIESSSPLFAKKFLGITDGYTKLQKRWILETMEAKQERYKVPHLIHRLRALFWAFVGSDHLNTSTAGLKEVFLEHLSSNEGRETGSLHSTESLKPNFYFEVGQQNKRIYVHDWILYARWPWFGALVDSGLSEIKAGFSSLPPSTLSEPTFVALIYYLYTNDPRAVDETACAEILENAEFYRIAELGVLPLKAYDYSAVLLEHCRHIISTRITPANGLVRLKLSAMLGPQSLIDRVVRLVADCREIALPTDDSLSPAIVEELTRLRLGEPEKKADTSPTSPSDTDSSEE